MQLFVRLFCAVSKSFLAHLIAAVYLHLCNVGVEVSYCAAGDICDACNACICTHTSSEAEGRRRQIKPLWCTKATRISSNTCTDALSETRPFADFCAHAVIYTDASCVVEEG